MIYNLYSIQDTLIGFNAPFIMVNEEVAVREYRNFLSTNKNSADQRLYKIGTFDDSTGTVIPIVPVIIEGGKPNE